MAPSILPHCPRWDAVPSISPYLIEQEVKPHDPLPLDSLTAVLFLLLRWLLYGLYLFRRYTLLATPSQSPAGIPSIVLLMEIGARFGPLLFQADMALYLFPPFRRRKSTQRPRYRLVGTESPTVDVFVTCCGEDVDLVMDTVRAAASQDYPMTRYRVFVLDDTHSPELQVAIKTYNARKSRSRSRGSQEVRYLARTKSPGRQHYFKAGNLRFGLEESKRITPGVASEYIAALDVDAIPESDWLRRLVPHLVLDPRLAAIVPGLRHYNLPPDDILCQDIATPWDIAIEQMRDSMGVTNLYGSGYVMRRSALESIGGWPLVASAEDLYCGHLLAGQGWELGFCWDICQHDLTPDSLDALVSQRLRWTEGDLNLAREFNFFIPWLDPGRQRTLARTATAVIGSLRLYRGIVDLLLMLLTPVLLLILQWTDNSSATHERSDTLLRVTYIASILADKLSPFFTSGLLMPNTTSISWLTPFEAAATIRYHLPNTTMTFTPTGTVNSSANERSAQSRRPLVQRLTTPSMRFYLAYLGTCVLCLLTSLAYTQQVIHPFISSTPLCVILIESLAAVSVPVRYMVWPPTVPGRRELLDEGERGERRPRAAPSVPARDAFAVPWVGALQILVVLILDWAA